MLVGALRAVLGAVAEAAGEGDSMVMNDGGAGAAVEARARRAAYAASAWAFAFAALSGYWAAGGTALADTLGASVTGPALAREPGFVALLWGVAAAKALLGLLALALASRSHLFVPRWLLLVAAWGAGAFMVLYAGANLAVRGLMAAGVMPTPEAMHSAAARWHLFLWDPWWLLGGLLFVATAWFAGRAPARGGDAVRVATRFREESRGVG
jgi:hypothetical protein